MESLQTRRIPFEFLALAGAILAIEVWICTRVLPTLEDSQALALAVIADLVLLIPGLYYFLEVKRRGRSASTMIPVVLCSLLVASKIVPSEQAGFLRGVYLLIPLVEILLLGAVLVAVVRTLRRSDGRADFLQVSQQATRRLVGENRAAPILAYELALLAYAFNFRRAPQPRPGSFTYHRRTALGAYTAVLLLITAAEIVPVHLLLSRWSPLVAWIVLGLTLYGAVWIVGDSRAMGRRPIQVGERVLHLRFGLRWSVEVPWSAVASLQQIRGGGTEPEKALSLVPMGAGANVELTLQQPVNADGPYGMKKSVERVLFYVDDVDDFLQACRRFQV